MVDGKEEMVNYKVVMLGESDVGKTCIVNKYINDTFGDQKNTIGSNFSSKIETVKPAGVAQQSKVKL